LLALGDVLFDACLDGLASHYSPKSALHIIVNIIENRALSFFVTKNPGTVRRGAELLYTLQNTSSVNTHH
jgi:hypothetical protein